LARVLLPVPADMQAIELQYGAMYGGTPRRQLADETHALARTHVRRSRDRKGAWRKKNNVTIKVTYVILIGMV